MSSRIGNPWLEIPLDDYEAHMALPTVGQARMLADALEALVARYTPRSVAVLGCSGGNGFDRMERVRLDRLVGVDISAAYIERARRRYAGAIKGLELYAADIEGKDELFSPVELIYAALVFEYVEPSETFDFARRHCMPNGLFATIVQLPHEHLDRVSPSPYTSLNSLKASSHWVPPEQLQVQALRRGFRSEDANRIEAPDGKQFAVEIFRRVTADESPSIGLEPTEF